MPGCSGTFLPYWPVLPWWPRLSEVLGCGDGLWGKESVGWGVIGCDDLPLCFGVCDALMDS